MKIVLSTLTLLLLLGCSGEDKAAKSETANTPKETVEAPASEPAPAAAETAAPAAAPEPAPITDGDTLYKQKCASCHGQKAEKTALSMSRVIKGWEASRVVDALNGYKAGTYGGKMKAMMEGQVKPLNEEQIEALAEFISRQ